ncbi:hypothetical protein BJV78DRAFT_1158041 [Lactifluus subvellereus]|nr:hypothetical protein BJV78DRAFT_1158041 [Lactifluus subvellereus]
MSALPVCGRPNTRATNADKHPGIPDQKKKRWSPAEVAAIRANERALPDAKEAEELAAPLIIAGIEDRSLKPSIGPELLQTLHGIAAVMARRSTRPQGQNEDSESSIEQFSDPGDTNSSGDGATSVLDEPSMDGEFLDEPVKRGKKKGKKKGKGRTRALIASKRAYAIPKKGDDNQDVVMEGPKWKGTLNSHDGTGIAKKSKLAIPSGLIKGFVPVRSKAESQAATNRWVTSVTIQAIQAQAAASLHGEGEPINVEVKMGGLEVVDDDGIKIIERKYPKYAAADKVKPKGRKSERFQAVVGVILNRPTERLGASSTIQNATKESKTTFINADLPTLCLTLWNRQYVPLLVDWAGTLPNPWKCHNVDIQGNMQAMWNTVYPDIDTDIQPKQPIFVRVCITIISKSTSDL